jgi:hypothetical protein
MKLTAAAYRFALVTVAAAIVPAAGRAQTPTPATTDLPSFTTIGSGANPALGQDGGFTDVAGTAGTNPGWSLFRYGTAGSGSGRLRITAVSTSPASEAYWTAAPASPNLSAAPAGFIASASGSWVIITPKGGATAPLQVTVDDLSPTTFLPLTDPAQLAAYDARLNEVLRFDASHWYDPSTGGPIDPSVGTFSYGFTDFDATLGYRSIELRYTPVPEPSRILGAAAVALAVVGSVRRGPARVNNSPR